MTDASVRDARPDDVEALAAIYNHYVLNSTATFDTEPKSVQDRLVWLESHGPEHPVIVASRSGVVVGWGSLSSWNTRCAYRHSVEVSIYVAPESVGTGVGSLLMAELLERAALAGHHAVVSQIVSGNDASIRLSERFGFERIGTWREVGRKFDRWLDVELLEKIV